MEVFTEYSDFGTETIRKGFTVKERGRASGHVAVTLESSLNLSNEEMQKIVDALEGCINNLKEVYKSFDK